MLTRESGKLFADYLKNGSTGELLQEENSGWEKESVVDSRMRWRRALKICCNDVILACLFVYIYFTLLKVSFERYCHILPTDFGFNCKGDVEREISWWVCGGGVMFYF